MKHDPNLKTLSEQPLVFHPPLLKHLPRTVPGIYTITGGRQIGKTTVLKLWMADLLSNGIPPSRIAYLSGELIDDHHSLVRLLTDMLKEGKSESIAFVLVDEVRYIREWDRGVKYLADAGLLRKAVLLLTGSDSAMLRDARSRFPGCFASEGRMEYRLA
jgi:uncharacterized protein